MKKIKKALPFALIIVTLCVLFAIGISAEECEHDWVVYDYTSATCTQDGQYEYYCENGCDAEHWYEDDPNTATGHSYVNGVCSTCGDTCTHTYVNGTCSECGAVCNHSFTYAPSGEGEEAEETYHIQTCSNCGMTQGAVEAHTWGPVMEEEENAYLYRVCDVCSYIIIVNDDLCYHYNYSYVSAGADGHTSVCQTCGFSEGTVSAHTWDSGVVTTRPTIASNGVRTYTCTLCGQTTTEVILALDTDAFVNDLTDEQALALYEKLFDDFGESLVTQIDYDKRLDAFANLPSATVNPMIEEIFEKIFFYQSDGDYGRWQYQLMENTDIGYWYAHYFATEIFPDIVENSARSQYYEDFDDVYYAILAKNPSNSLDYQRGYDDAMGSVIDGNPIQGLFQAMWSSTLLFVSTVANGVGIGGITLMSVLMTVAVLAIVWFIIKIVKG